MGELCKAFNLTETVERDEEGRLLCYNGVQNFSLNKVSQNRFKEVVGIFTLNQSMNNENLNSVSNRGYKIPANADRLGVN